jgi:3-isopropylmalate/(R)-2-methylmalate dehydratase small subunit
MAGWSTHRGRAVALPLENVDTDQLIPARFMSVPRSAGYGPYLLHDLRRDATGGLRDDLALNRVTDASILIAGRNFGCGSSREAAVYALVDAGFKAVLAPGFGDIFAANAVNNGLLPAQVDADVIDRLLTLETTEMEIDLSARTVTIGEEVIPFALDDTRRIKLQNGWDDIDLTLAEAGRIASFRSGLERQRPWLWPGV